MLLGAKRITIKRNYGSRKGGAMAKVYHNNRTTRLRRLCRGCLTVRINGFSKPQSYREKRFRIILLKVEGASALEDM
jgi:hypothetical protein